MIKVLILCPPLLNTVEYWRLWMPIQIIKDVYPGVFDFKFKRKDLTFEDAAMNHIIITARPGSKPDINEFLSKAKENGAKVIVDIDDHIFGLPDTHEIYHSYQKGSTQYEMAIKTCQMADIFWYSTPAFLKNYPKNGIVIPNAINPALLPDEPAPDRGLWAWRGRSIQVHDLIGEGWDWYAKIRKKPKQWMFLGWKPPLRHADNVTSVPYVSDIQQYIKKVRESRFNGIWKPMIDHPFNDHKSNISWIEATLSGGVCLTNYAGKPGWEFATANFPTYKEACALWEKSKQEIKERYNILTTAQQRVDSMLDLCSPIKNILQPTGATSP